MFKLKANRETLFTGIIFLTVTILFITNYTPNTYLSGWDNLQTELYPTLAIKRAFYSVWQEYQSLGLVAGMGHAADLIRAIFIWLISFILPQTIIRYFFHMLMLLIGGLGIFELLKLTGLDKEKKIFALFGALFYLLNFGTTQLFFLPFESFSIFYAFLPWQLWAFISIVSKEDANKKDWLKFFLVNLLATPYGVSQQLFVVYILILLLMSLGFLINLKKLFPAKKVIIAFVVLFFINSFWILPQLYFLNSSKAVVSDSKQNQLVTEDIFYNNLNKGNINDFLRLEGFFYDQSGTNQELLFEAWQKHRNTPLVNGFIYLFVVISFIGIFSRKKYHAGFILLYILVAVAILNNTAFFNTLNSLIRNNSFVNQIFRSPFTKFIIPYALVESYFLAFGIAFVFQRVSRFFLLIMACFIFLYALPSFRGYFISPQMKVTIPAEYFSIFDYFKTLDPNKRIALLPDYTFWGWFTHRWGYNGSGFIWYGIEQPVISRTFDIWSFKSESYFWEIKNAVEDEKVDEFENVLKKYNIDYIIFDHSLLPIVSSTRAIQYDRLEALLKESKLITLDQQFGFISVYKVNHLKKYKDFISLVNYLPNIGPSVTITNNDSAYAKYGDYQTNPQKPYSVYYPFLDFASQAKLFKKTWTINEGLSNWVITQSPSFSLDKYLLSTSSSQLKVNTLNQGVLTKEIIPITFTLKDNKVIVRFSKVLMANFNPKDTKLLSCGNQKGDVVLHEVNQGIEVSSSKGGTGCFDYNNGTLEQQYGYIVRVENQNTTGQRLYFYIMDHTKNQTYLEDRLKDNIEYYIIGSRLSHGMGYSFAFLNNSRPNIPSVNTLTNIDLYLIPYNELKTLRLTRGTQALPSSISLDTFDAKKLDYSSYEVSLNNNSAIESPITLVLSQSFDPGWKAYSIPVMLNSFQHPIGILKQSMKQVQDMVQNDIYEALPFLFGTELKNHVLVNNWANGWILPDQKSNIKDQKSAIEQFNNETIVILFWPQYLEYLGFILIFISFLWILKLTDT